MDKFDLANCNVLIEDYENLIKNLMEEVDHFKNEYNNLKSKTNLVVNENNLLREELKQLMVKREQEINSSSKELVSNLKQQLECLSNEKEIADKLWKNSMKTIDDLEDELRSYKSTKNNFVNKKEVENMRENYERRLKMLEAELAKAKKQAAEAEIEAKTKAREAGKSLEIQGDSLQIVKNLEEEILKLQKRQNDYITKIRTIEKKMEDKDKSITQLKEKNIEYREKVKEAVQVVDAALTEKDGALLREKEAKDQVENLLRALNELSQQTEEKIKSECALKQNECDKVIKSYSEDLKLAQEEIKLKQIEIENYKVRLNMLENEIRRVEKGNLNIEDSSTSRLLVLEKNLETTFQKLLISEKQNVQISSENESLRNDMNEMTKQYQRDINQREAERCNLQIKLKNLQNELDDCNTNYCKAMQRIEELNSKIESNESTYNKKLETKEEELKKLHEEKLFTINLKNEDYMKELREQLSAQIEVNKKWRVETKMITENLEKLISDLKCENCKVKKENKKMKQEINKLEKKVSQYKSFLQMISQDVTKISYLTDQKMKSFEGV